MITDTISNSAVFKCLSANFKKAFDFLQQADLDTLPLGKHVIDADNVYAIRSEYTTKDLSDARWEAHRLYADIQLLLAGEEKIGYAPLTTMKVTEDYNPEKDILFLAGEGDYVTIKPGVFAVFFPHDAHQPCVATGNPQNVKKLVVKVRVK
ncbi:MAG: YhcH/YjgK/YiaL family protein [Bacteroidales bacterium]|nr:YhcH/YjgK/YiaL family protein [Bacteroidales bacterium]